VEKLRNRMSGSKENPITFTATTFSISNKLYPAVFYMKIKVFWKKKLDRELRSL
jgi:hypothetical protein